jgi:hypothetical protein
MFKSLKPFRKEVAVDEPSKDNTIVVLKFFISHQKYQHQEPLQDLGIPSMIIDQFWEMMTKIIMNLSMESHLLQNKCMQNWYGPWGGYMSGIILHVYVACNLSKVVFQKRFSRVEALI